MAYAVFIGSPCVDEYYRLKDGWPPLGDKAVAEAAGQVPGGMIANAACVCAAQGVETHLFDVMAESESTCFLLDDLEAAGVRTGHVVRKAKFKETKCIIFQKGGERTIIVVTGDNPPHPVQPQQQAFLRGAAAVFTSLSCMGNLAGGAALMADLHAHGVKLVLDNEASTHRPGWEDSLRWAHTLFFNEFSAEVFAEGLPQEAFMQKLLGLGVHNVVLTLGPLGCRVVSRAGEDFSVPVYPVKVVDTTGAGDTFNSSFMAGLLRGWPLRRCAQFATAAANRAVTIQGPRGGVATVAQVEAFMAAQEA